MSDLERQERSRALLRGLGVTLALGVPFLIIKLDTTMVMLAGFFGSFLAAYSNRAPMVMPVAIGALLGLLGTCLLLALLEGPSDGVGFLLLVGFAAALAGAATGERAALKK